MNRDEEDLARRIAGRLDEGLADIRQGTLYQLQVARQAALDRYRDEPASVFANATAALTRSGYIRFLGARYLLPFVACFVMVSGTWYWNERVLVPDSLAEIDSLLLADDLPPHAYLDKGFDSWLKRSPQ
jgi:hypothetical protein